MSRMGLCRWATTTQPRCALCPFLSATPIHTPQSPHPHWNPGLIEGCQRMSGAAQPPDPGGPSPLRKPHPHLPIFCLGSAHAPTAPFHTPILSRHPLFDPLGGVRNFRWRGNAGCTSLFRDNLLYRALHKIRRAARCFRNAGVLQRPLRGWCNGLTSCYPRKYGCRCTDRTNGSLA